MGESPSTAVAYAVALPAPYSTCESASSFVVHDTPTPAVALIALIVGAVVSRGRRRLRTTMFTRS